MITKVKEGEIKLVFQGITNIEEMKKSLETNLEKYRNIIWTEDTRKDIKKMIEEELQPDKTKLLKAAAAFKSAGEEQISAKYQEIKKLEKMIGNIIKELKASEEEYKEKKRLERLEKKKQMALPIIKEINAELETIELPPYTDLELLEWDDEWAKMKDDDIKMKIDEITDTITSKLKSRFERIKFVETTVKLLKSEYELTSDINWQQLKEAIYEDGFEKELDDMAAFMQEQETRIKEEQEELQRRKEKQAKEEQERKEREAREQQEKREREAQREREEAEKRHQDELDRIKREQEEKEQARIAEEKRKEKAEADRIEAEKQAEIDIQKKIESEKKVEKVLKFNITKTQAELMLNYFKENKIQYEVIL